MNTVNFEMNLESIEALAEIMRDYEIEHISFAGVKMYRPVASVVRSLPVQAEESQKTDTSQGDELYSDMMGV